MEIYRNYKIIAMTFNDISHRERSEAILSYKAETFVTIFL